MTSKPSPFVAEARAAGDIGALGAAEDVLRIGLGQLFALAEDYPELKADQSFLDLQQNLTEVENHLQYARRYYNGAVRNLNVRVDTFPDMIVARLLRFRKALWFQFDAA